MLIQDTGKQQRQNTGQDDPGHQRQNSRNIGRQFADNKLAQHGTDIIHHHISRQQATTVARGSAAHQRALHHDPDHGAAHAGNKAPEHPAPEAQHKAQPNTTSSKDKRSNVIAEVKPETLNQTPGEHGTDQVTGKIGRSDHPHLPGRQIFMGKPKRDERV